MQRSSHVILHPRWYLLCATVLLLLLVGCDSATTPNEDLPLDEGDAVPRVSVTGVSELALARKHLDASLMLGSIDDIFIRLADRFEGFGGCI